MQRYLLVVLASVLLAGCSTPPPPPPLPVSAIRDYQTRLYNTTNTLVVMRVLMNVLQDEGYVVKMVVSEQGLLSVAKDSAIENPKDVCVKRSCMAMSCLGGVYGIAIRKAANLDTWPQISRVEASAHVSPLGDQTKVRVSFQKKLVDNHGKDQTVEAVGDRIFYEIFYTRVDEGLFLQAELDTPAAVKPMKPNQ